MHPKSKSSCWDIIWTWDEHESPPPIVHCFEMVLCDMDSVCRTKWLFIIHYGWNTTPGWGKCVGPTRAKTGTCQVYNLLPEHRWHAQFTVVCCVKHSKLLRGRYLVVVSGHACNGCDQGIRLGRADVHYHDQAWWWWWWWWWPPCIGNMPNN